MARLVDVLAVLLLIGAAAAFGMGLRVLAQRQDLLALYWLVVGIAALHASTSLLRPKAGSR